MECLWIQNNISDTGLTKTKTTHPDPLVAKRYTHFAEFQFGKIPVGAFGCGNLNTIHEFVTITLVVIFRTKEDWEMNNGDYGI